MTERLGLISNRLLELGIAKTSVTAVSLKRWYRKKGCRYVTPPYHITNSYSVQQMQGLQTDFATKLNKLWNDDVELLFLDECSIHPWRK